MIHTNEFDHTCARVETNYPTTIAESSKLSESISNYSKMNVNNQRERFLCSNNQSIQKFNHETIDNQSSDSSLVSIPREKCKYRDLSRKNNSSPKSKRSTFPVTLHKILTDPSYSDIITWLPHGRSWIVLNPKSFEEYIIPSHFEHCSYSSFSRQVNGWGFIRVKYGRDHNSYYNEVRTK